MSFDRNVPNRFKERNEGGRSDAKMHKSYPKLENPHTIKHIRPLVP